MIREIGDGTCGNVFRAYNTETNEIVSAALGIVHMVTWIFSC